MTRQRQEEEKYMTAAQARKYLGANGMQMAMWLRDGTLPSSPDPLDHRVKLIPVSAVEALKRERDRLMERRAATPKAMKKAS